MQRFGLYLLAATLVVVGLSVSSALAETSYIASDAHSGTPAIDETSDFTAPNDGSILDEESINFDDLTAPPSFSQAEPLTNEYADQGIVFEGMGEVLHEDANLGISNYSSPNFLAFDTGAGVPGPGTMLFNPPVSYLTLSAGHSSAGTITMTAYDGMEVVDTDVIVGSSALAMMTVEADNITRVVISFTSSVMCVDNLDFEAVDQLPVTLTLTPATDLVPATGGNVVYDASVVSTIGLSMGGLQYRTYVTLPDQQTLQVGPTIPWNLTPFMNLTVPGMTQYIPDYAPQGDYYFEGRAGVLSNPALTITDGFTFTKNAGGGANLFEDFSDGQAQGFNWLTTDGTLSIDGGYAKMDMTTTEEYWGSSTYETTEFNNFSLETTVKVAGGSGAGRGHLWCANGPYDDDLNGYSMYFSGSFYSVWKYTNGSAAIVVFWTHNARINTGEDAVNVIRCDAFDGTFDLYINDVYVNSFSDTAYPQGYVGLIACFGTDTWFDDIACTSTEFASVPQAPAEPGILVDGYFDDMFNPVSEPMQESGCRVFDRFGAEQAEFEFIPEDWAASGHFITSDDAGTISIPTEFEMTTAYPNPFNPSTSFAIVLPSVSDLTVTVFNVMGQEVAILANGQFNAGQHNFSFDAANLSSGVYFIQATVPGHLNQVQKVMLVR